MQTISHCQKYFVVNTFFITIFDVQNSNSVPLCFLLSMVRAGHTKISVWSYKTQDFLAGQLSF